MSFIDDMGGTEEQDFYTALHILGTNLNVGLCIYLYNACTTETLARS